MLDVDRSAHPGLSLDPAILEPKLPRSPYPGLRPFLKHEWPIFFGREAITDQVIARLIERHMVLVHGSSGSGKSSLIRAGVLPRLEQDHASCDLLWRTCAMVPGGSPLCHLAEALAELDGEETSEDRILKIRRILNRGRDAGPELADMLRRGPQDHICVLVDQFEELFEFAKNNQEQAILFAEILVGLAEKPSAGLYVVITMRSDYFGECARFPGLAETVNQTQYLLPRMDRAALLRAIREPAELYGGEVSRELAERVIADASAEQDELPLIQHGLMVLWREASIGDSARPQPKLDLGRYTDHGGLAFLLSEHADAVFAAVAPDKLQRKTVEYLFRTLTDTNAEGNAVKRRQSFADLCAATGASPEYLREVIDAFRAEGVSFLRPYGSEPIRAESEIDISHEALIRCWQRIADPENGWLQREFQDGLIWRSLLAPAERFQKNPKDVLSPALTEDRRVWLQGRPPDWCERYGGGWQAVTELMESSAAAAAKAWQRDAWRRSMASTPVRVALVVAAIMLGFVGENVYWAMVRGLPLEVLKERWVYKLGIEELPFPALNPIPAGSFMMGSERERRPAAYRVLPAHPVHRVTFAQPFYLGRTEVTFREWDACVADGACNGYRPADQGWGRDERPVINVSWEDAKAYVAWLSQKMGKDCRLPSEAEWEYAARAGTTTEYALPPPDGSDDIQGKGLANCADCGSEWDNKQTAPVGQFPPNAWGLHDMHGNIWEWVEDCAHDNYEGAPANGRAWREENADNCSFRVLRGGSWFGIPVLVSSADRLKFDPNQRVSSFGFRVVCSSP